MPSTGASFPLCLWLGSWHFLVSSTVKKIWPSSFPYSPYPIREKGSGPAYLFLAGSGCWEAVTTWEWLSSLSYLKLNRLVPNLYFPGTSCWTGMLWQLRHHCSHLNKSVCFSWNVGHVQLLAHAKATGRSGCPTAADRDEIIPSSYSTKLKITDNQQLYWVIYSLTRQAGQMKKTQRRKD